MKTWAIKISGRSGKTSLFLFLWSLSIVGCQLSTKPETDLGRKLPEANLENIDPESFTDAEIDLPYYLGHFHQLANAVLLEGPNRGFIDISVWRRTRDNQPYNARIMENILSLSYFYANDRSWNPYYNSPQLRHRLEAALAFWCDIQSSQGAFSEYGPQKWNLAASAFATKFMGESLQWIHNGPPIDSTVLERVKATDRKAIHHVLTDSAFYDFGQRYSNQYSNVWAGALAYLDLYPDPEIDTLLRRRLKQSMTTFQSPAGYFYEANGPDWSYNLGTHHSNLHMAFHYAKDAEIKEMLARKERAFSEWLAYNCIPEPGEEVFVLNRGVECRQLRPFFEPYGWLLSQGIPLVSVDSLSHAFVLDELQVQQVITTIRAQTIREWPKIDPLPIGEFHAFSPYAFLYRNHQRSYPSAQEREFALQNLPVYGAPFVHQRYDPRNETVYTFIKTPTYYVVFNSGQKVRDQQRFGIGLLGTPEKGALLQTQTQENKGAWGSRLHPDSLPYEGRDLDATFYLNGEELGLRPGNRDLAEGLFSLCYSLPGLGTKELIFYSDRIHVKIEARESFSEHLPLLATSSEVIQASPGKIQLPGIIISLEESQFIPNTVESKDLLMSKKLFVAQLRSQGTLDYDIILAN